MASRRSGDGVVCARIVRVERERKRGPELAQTLVDGTAKRKAVRVDFNSSDAELSGELDRRNAVPTDQRIAARELHQPEVQRLRISQHAPDLGP